MIFISSSWLMIDYSTVDQNHIITHSYHFPSTPSQDQPIWPLYSNLLEYDQLAKGEKKMSHYILHPRLSWIPYPLMDHYGSSNPHLGSGKKNNLWHWPKKKKNIDRIYKIIWMSCHIQMWAWLEQKSDLKKLLYCTSRKKKRVGLARIRFWRLKNIKLPDTIPMSHENQGEIELSKHKVFF